MPTTTDTDSILLAVAAFLFAFAVIALIAWAFKTFMLTGRSGAEFLAKGANDGSRRRECSHR